MARRNARDRVFADHDRSTSTSTTDDFPAVGAYDIASTVDGPPDPYVREVDGQPGKYVLPRVLRHRAPVEVDSQSSAKLGQRSADLLTGAVTAAEKHLTPAETVEHASTHPSVRPMLRHLFGTNLPGRDRA
jgi:hypothetical protein